MKLHPHPTRRAPDGPVVMVIMDGIGLGRGDESDAVAVARTPTLDWLMGLPSATALRAHGTAVGMPSDGDMGNSEVGHNAIGAGRVFQQGASLVDDAIRSGRIFEGEVWRDMTARVRASGEPLHFIGLLSDGNVHSHIDHLLAMIDRAAQQDVKAVRVHVLLDGRDVDARSARIYTDRLEQALSTARAAGHDYRVASGGGRMVVTMDRYEADWAMVRRGWEIHVRGLGRQFHSVREAIDTLYAESDRGDQDLEGFVIADDDGPVGPIRDGAAVIFFNFRGDRAIEISRAFCDDDAEFDAFDRGGRPDVAYAGMMEYDGDTHVPARYLVEPPAIDQTMGELLAAAGRRQLAIAETHKYGHVTYFWNGNRSDMFDPRRETYVQIASDLEPTQTRPWMKAGEVTDRLVAELNSEQPPDFVRVNFANGDMVGHTGVLESTRIACEVVDLCIARLVATTRQLRGALIVTADHGNADHMFDERDGARRIRTSHSLNPVPFSIFDPRGVSQGPQLRAFGPDAVPGLGNLAATALEVLGFAAPDGYLPSLLRP